MGTLRSLDPVPCGYGVLRWVLCGPQTVHAEMQRAMQDKDDLKIRVQAYIAEVARVERLIAAKARNHCCP